MKQVSLFELLQDCEKIYSLIQDGLQRESFAKASNHILNVVQTNSKYPPDLWINLPQAAQYILSSYTSQNGTPSHTNSRQIEDILKKRDAFDVEQFEKKYKENPNSVLLTEWLDYQEKRIKFIPEKDKKELEQKALTLLKPLLESNFDYPLDLQIPSIQKADEYIQSSWCLFERRDEVIHRRGESLEALEKLTKQREAWKIQNFKEKYGNENPIIASTIITPGNGLDILSGIFPSPTACNNSQAQMLQLGNFRKI